MNIHDHKYRLITYDFVFETQNFPLALQKLDRLGSPGWHYHEKFYEIVLVTSGDTTHICESHSNDLQPQEILIIAPGMHHNYGDKKICYYNMLVDLDFAKLPLFDIVNTEGFQRLFVLTVQSYMQTGNSVIRNFLDTEDFAQAIVLLKKMTALQKEQHPGWQLGMVGIFIEFLQLICQACTHHSSLEKSAAQSMTKISNLAVNMAQHCEQKWPISRMCKLCGMSRAGLFREFHKYYQTSPAQFLIRQRLRKACALLKETEKNVEMVATDCGFANGNYLGTVFKEHYRLTPLQYRRKYRDISASVSGYNSVTH